MFVPVDNETAYDAQTNYICKTIMFVVKYGIDKENNRDYYKISVLDKTLKVVPEIA